MDQVKIGAFISQLRREKGWTQEELGERLGLSNKTVSRWENGNYMPSIEMLTLLSREFGVSLNELVEGQRLDEEDEFRAAADKNLASAMEGRLDKFWRWIERYGAYAAVLILLCGIIVLITFEHYRYTQAHPADVNPAGTWNTYYAGAREFEEYIVLDKKGGYYRYRQFEPLEQGTWTEWSNGKIIVETRAGSFALLVKGTSLYVPDRADGLTRCSKISDTPTFINVREEDFTE